MAINTDTAFTESPPESTETTLIQATPGEITLPEGFTLASADFARVGADLVLTAPDGAQIVIRDFFALGEFPELVSAEGAHVPGELTVKLAGPLAPGQVAQAAPGASPEPIGQVENVDGEVVAIRPDGTRVELEVGDPVYQGDVLESGEDGAIGIVLADETSFSMAENGRMVLDEMVYDPGTQEGTIALSVMQGVFTFISGEVAKADPDAMTVSTPVATIGIRGTQIGIAFKEGEPMKLLLMEEGDGFVGEVVVQNEGGVQILNQANQGVTVASADEAPSQPETVSPEAIAETYGKALLSMPASANVNTYGAEDEASVNEEGETEEAAAEEEVTEEEATEEAAAEEEVIEEEVAAGEEITEEEVENLEDFATAAGGGEGDTGDDIEISDLGFYGGGDDDGGPDIGGNLVLSVGGNLDLGGGGDDPVDPDPVDPDPDPLPVDPDPVDPDPVDPFVPPSLGLGMPFEIPTGPSEGPVISVIYTPPTGGIEGITDVVNLIGGDSLEGTDFNDTLTGASVGESYSESNGDSYSDDYGGFYDSVNYGYDYYTGYEETYEENYTEITANSELIGAAGDDLLIGGLGENDLSGDEGNDVLVGGSDYNIYDSTYSTSGTQSGYDSYHYYSNSDYPYDYEQTYSYDYEYVDYYADQELDGGDGEDILIGGVGYNDMDGGDDADVMYGASGYNWWVEEGSETQTYARTNITNFYGDEGSTGHDWNGVTMEELDQSVTYDYSEWNTYASTDMYGGFGDDQMTAGVGGTYMDGNDGNDVMILGTGLNEEYYEESGTASGFTLSNSNQGGLYFADGIFSEGGFGEDGGFGEGGGFGEFPLGDVSLDGTYSLWEYEADAYQSANGGYGDDTITGGDGYNDLYGDGGDDVISGSTGYELDAFSATAADGDATVEGWSMHAYSNIYGGDGNDQITGGLGDNYLDGDSGDDVITGGTTFNLEALAAQFVDDAGNFLHMTRESADAYNSLYGDDGEDLLTGGVGDNNISGGADDDVITGSTGYNFESLSASITDGEGNIEVSSGEVYEAWSDLYGDAGNDTITGGVGYNYIDGGSGNDIITGGGVNESYATGIFSEGSEDGWSADGNYYDNYLFGGDGNDTIISAAGDDYMYGYLDDDTFVFGAGGGSDYIDDFGTWGSDTMVFEGFGSGDLGYSENANGNLVITAGGTEVVVNNYDLQDVNGGELSITEVGNDVIIAEAVVVF